MFPDKNTYENCGKNNLNYIKNVRPSGAFMTKPNHAGYRYYGYVPGTKDNATPKSGSCANKIAILWDDC